MESKIALALLDIIVLVALGGTMLYLRRLSVGIKTIRDGKSEMQKLLQQLNIHISNAQHSIDNMNKLADNKAKDMQKNIEDAQAAIDDLQFIQKAADNVAMRLEKLTQSTPITANEASAPTQHNVPQRTVSKAEKQLAEAMAAKTAKGKGE